MNHGYVKALSSLLLAACAAPGPDLNNPSESAESMQTGETPTAAEAVYVKNNVPDAAKESGLVDENTKVCKKEKIVGSHIPRIVCLSAKEHERLQKISQGYMSNSKRTPEPKRPEG